MLELHCDGREKLHVSDHVTKLLPIFTPVELRENFKIYGEELGVNLSIGDYMIKDESTVLYAFERKSITDFRNSFLEKKLFIQLEDLFNAKKEKHAQHIGLLLEGIWPENIMQYHEGNPNWAAIKTIITQLELRGMLVMLSNNPEGTAYNLISCLNVQWKRNVNKTVKPIDPATAKMEQKIEMITKEMGVREDWMYPRAFLELFDGVSKERAEYIAKLFDFSIGRMITEAKSDPINFKEKIRSFDGIRFRVRLPEKIADNVIRILLIG